MTGQATVLAPVYPSIGVWARIAVSPAVLGGGVTVHHLKHQISLWRGDLKRVLGVVSESQEALAGKRLN